MNDWKSLSQIKKIKKKCKKKMQKCFIACKKNLTQIKKKYVHVKAEVLRISKLVYFLRIDQIWSQNQAKQDIYRKLNICFEFQH